MTLLARFHLREQRLTIQLVFVLQLRPFQIRLRLWRPIGRRPRAHLPAAAPSAANASASGDAALYTSRSVGNGGASSTGNFDFIPAVPEGVVRPNAPEIAEAAPGNTAPNPGGNAGLGAPFPNAPEIAPGSDPSPGRFGIGRAAPGNDGAGNVPTPGNFGTGNFVRRAAFVSWSPNDNGFHHAIRGPL